MFSTPSTDMRLLNCTIVSKFASHDMTPINLKIFFANSATLTIFNHTRTSEWEARRDGERREKRGERRSIFFYLRESSSAMKLRTNVLQTVLQRPCSRNFN